MIAFRALAPYAAASPRPAPTPRCEICGSELAEAHRHVVELGKRGAMCACQACAILFSHAEPGRQFRTIPERFLTDGSFAMSAPRWASLGIPVTLAFFYLDSTRDTVLACYPGPAGITDAELDPMAWHAISSTTPLAGMLEPDVEALLVRGGRAVPSCHLVPISTAYELVGRLRSCWRGFSGGDAVERELAELFAGIERRGGKR